MTRALPLLVTSALVSGLLLISLLTMPDQPEEVNFDDPKGFTFVQRCETQLGWGRARRKSTRGRSDQSSGSRFRSDLW